ncbi:MAG: phosphate ABC transporter substrate-binding protein PstS [Nitrososphaerota archaeon]|jgi:phosphate ABC transporter phosphate-binding protein|nr:phosphate ABC transporter substrate-binding protein PstS [Nitrososphaerota archaeon]
MNTKYVITIVAIAIIVCAIVAITYTPVEIVSLNGAGASFPFPLLSSIITKYQDSNSYVEINYNPSGSGAGISALTDKTVDFAGSDASLSISESEKAPNVLHIPETIGSIAIAYNVEGLSSGLKLTGQVVADIFEGKITKWNDPAIAKLNPDVILHSATINVIRRSDSSGTTYIFTGYLSAASSSWENNVGQAKSVEWPVGIGASGNQGSAQTISSTKNSIGYVELAYALQTDMTFAAVQNPSGNFILPSLDSTTVAAQAVASLGLPAGNENWSSVNLLNADDATAYPIVGFSYLMVYKELNVIDEMTQARATELVNFLWYVVHDGQDLAIDVDYASLPSNVVDINSATIKSITFNGQQVLT